MRRPRSSWAARAALVVALCTGAAAADDPNRRALKLAYEADDLYARGQWATAYDRFAEADALAHSPVFVLYMARCRKNAGRLLEAESILARLARETVAPDAPKPFRDAVASAAAERDDVARRIPHVRLVVRGVPEGPLVVRVDGKEVADPKAALTIDPGAHTFEAASAGRSARQEALVADGAAEVSVVLSLDPAARRAEPEPNGGSVVPAVVALSFGVLGVAVGAVTGLMASSKASDVKGNCVDGHCLASDADALDRARGLARVSTIAFIAGGVGLAAAGVFLVWRPGGGGRATAILSPAGLGAVF